MKVPRWTLILEYFTRGLVAISSQEDLDTTRNY